MQISKTIIPKLKEVVIKIHSKGYITTKLTNEEIQKIPTEKSKYIWKN